MYNIDLTKDEYGLFLTTFSFGACCSSSYSNFSLSYAIEIAQIIQTMKLAIAKTRNTPELPINGYTAITTNGPIKFPKASNVLCLLKKLFATSS